MLPWLGSIVFGCDVGGNADAVFEYCFLQLACNLCSLAEEHIVGCGPCDVHLIGYVRTIGIAYSHGDVVGQLQACKRELLVLVVDGNNIAFIDDVARKILHEDLVLGVADKVGEGVVQAVTDDILEALSALHIQQFERSILVASVGALFGQAKL